MNDKDNLMNGFPPGGQPYNIPHYMMYNPSLSPQGMHQMNLSQGISSPGVPNGNLNYAVQQNMYVPMNPRYMTHQKPMSMGYNPLSTSSLSSALNEGRSQLHQPHINTMSHITNKMNGMITPHQQKLLSMYQQYQIAKGPFAAAKSLGRNTYRDDAEQWAALDMSGMRLKSLSPQLFQYEFLTTLYLAYNALEFLPPEICQLRNLQKLDLSANNLGQVPPELGLLINLRELLLFDNSITHLPGGLGSLFRLEYFGLEGNPLTEPIRERLHTYGTLGLISYLRDNMDIGEDPQPRSWINFEKEDKDNIERITMMTYNILSEKYATQQQYPYTPSYALAWKYRKEKIINEIISRNSDIICLQEIEAGQFETFFKPALQKHDYEGLYWCKSRAKTMSEKERLSVDGCATFYKTKVFSVIESSILEFNSVINREDFKSGDSNSSDIFNRLMNKDNVAGITMFETKEKKQRLLTANAHIHWDPEYADVKVVQVAILTGELEKIVHQHSKKSAHQSATQRLPIIVCGDFNSLPDSGVHNFLDKGELLPDHPDISGRSYGDFTKHGVKHTLGLKSACDGLGFTNFTPTFTALIDYIWYTPSCLTVSKLLANVERNYLSKYVGFPNAHFPSDHVPLVVELKLKAKTINFNIPQFNSPQRQAPNQLTGSGPSTHSFNQKKHYNSGSNLTKANK